MARGFPPSSAYLGSDLPEEELMMPAGAPGASGAPPAPPANLPLPGEPEQAAEPLWFGPLRGVIEREGLDIDPNVLLQGAGGDPTRLQEALDMLGDAVTTDMEVEALDQLLEEIQPQGVAPTLEPVAPPAAAPGAQPAAPPEPTFTPDRPGTTRF